MVCWKIVKMRRNDSIVKIGSNYHRLCHVDRTGKDKTGQDRTRQDSTVQYSTVQYSTVQYSTVQYSTVQDRTGQYSNLISSPKHDNTLDRTTNQIMLDTLNKNKISLIRTDTCYQERVT